MADTDFSLDLSNFADLSEDKMSKVVRASFIGLSSDIIKGTPVSDTKGGRARGGWLPDINGFDESVSDSKDTDGSKTVAKVVSESSKFRLGDTLTLSNNVPYIVKLEFGLYPKGGAGTKTINGFSTQAPAGMVRLNIQRWQQIVNSKVKK